LDAAAPPPRRASAALRLRRRASQLTRPAAPPRPAPTRPAPPLPAPPRPVPPAPPAPPAVSSWVFAHAADLSDPALARPTAAPLALSLQDATLEPNAALPPADAAAPAPLEPLAPARAVEFAPDAAPGAARAASPGALIGLVVRGYAPGNFDAAAAGAVCAALAAAGAAPKALIECDLGAPAPAPAASGAAATAVVVRLRWRWAAPPSADAVAVARARRDALVAALAADANAVLKRARLPGLLSFALDCACRGTEPVVDAAGDGVAYAPVPNAAPALCGAALTRARREDPTALVGVDDGSTSGGADAGKFCAWPTPPSGGIEGTPGTSACRRYGVSTGEADRAAARATALRIVRLEFKAAGAGLTTFPAVAIGPGAPNAEAAARAGVDGVAPRAAPSGLYAGVPQLEARGDGAGFRAAVLMGLAPRTDPTELFADAGDGCVGGAWRIEVAPPRDGDAPGGKAAAATLRVAGGRAVGVELIAAGAGYDAIPDVSLAPETVGLMACARAPEFALGAWWLGVVGVDVLAPGAGFSAPPALALVGGGEAAPAELVPTFTVTGLEYRGTGNFTAPPAVRVLAADAAEHAAAAAVMGLAAAEVSAPGAGYPNAWPQVSVAQGGGEGAVVAAVAVAGGVAELIVTAAGEGFSGLPLLEVTPPPGSSAGELCAAAGDLIDGVGFLHTGGVEVGGPCAPLALDSRSGEVCSRPVAPGAAAGAPGVGTCGARSYYFSGPPAPGAELDDADASQCLLLAAEFETAVGAIVEPAAPAPSELEQADAPSEAAALRADAPRHATAAAPLPRARPFAAPAVGGCAYPTGAYRLHAAGRSACGDGECLIGATASSTFMRCMPSILTCLSLSPSLQSLSPSPRPPPTARPARRSRSSCVPPRSSPARSARRSSSSGRCLAATRCAPGAAAARAAPTRAPRPRPARRCALAARGPPPTGSWSLPTPTTARSWRWCAPPPLQPFSAARVLPPPCPPAHRCSPAAAPLCPPTPSLQRLDAAPASATPFWTMPSAAGAARCGGARALALSARLYDDRHGFHPLQLFHLEAAGAAAPSAAEARAALAAARAPAPAADLAAVADARARAVAPAPAGCSYRPGRYSLAPAAGRAACGAEAAGYRSTSAGGGACAGHAVRLAGAAAGGAGARALFDLETTSPGRHALLAAGARCGRGGAARAAADAGRLRLRADGAAADWALEPADATDCSVVAIRLAGAAPGAPAFWSAPGATVAGVGCESTEIFLADAVDASGLQLWRLVPEGGGAPAAASPVTAVSGEPAAGPAPRLEPGTSATLAAPIPVANVGAAATAAAPVTVTVEVAEASDHVVPPLALGPGTAQVAAATPAGAELASTASAPAADGGELEARQEAQGAPPLELDLAPATAAPDEAAR
jgi:hypothetical protein